MDVARGESRINPVLCCTRLAPHPTRRALPFPYREREMSGLNVGVVGFVGVARFCLTSSEYLARRFSMSGSCRGQPRHVGVVGFVEVECRGCCAGKNGLAGFFSSLFNPQSATPRRSQARMRGRVRRVTELPVTAFDNKPSAHELVARECLMSFYTARADGDLSADSRQQCDHVLFGRFHFIPVRFAVGDQARGFKLKIIPQGVLDLKKRFGLPLGLDDGDGLRCAHDRASAVCEIVGPTRSGKIAGALADTVTSIDVAAASCVVGAPVAS